MNAIPALDAIPVVDEFGTQLLRADAAAELGARVVGYLRAHGHEPGARIAFRAANSALVLAGIFGALRAGYAPVVIGDKLTPREVGELLADIRPAATLDVPTLTRAVESPPAAGLRDSFACRPIHFTSGTTGQPKAVWSGWLSLEDSAALAREEADIWGFRADDLHLVCGPLSHSAPLRFSLFTFAAGGAVLLPSAFSAPVVVALLAEQRPTTTFMAPTHLQRILDVDAPLTPSFRLLAHAGSNCPERVRRHAWDVFGTDAVREFYGSTEGQFTVCTPQEWQARPGTVGRARPGRVLRVDDDGRFWCKTPRHARFVYWGDPEKTEQAWRGDEFTLGDLGRIDDEGYVFLEGRRSDLIITGGVNVYPAEIERVVTDLPGVHEAVAFGVDDEQWGQKVCLAVIGEVTSSQVSELCRDQLAPYKRPKAIRVVDELPRTHSGKVDRVAVVDQLGPTL